MKPKIALSISSLLVFVALVFGESAGLFVAPSRAAAAESTAAPQILLAAYTPIPWRTPQPYYNPPRSYTTPRPYYTPRPPASTPRAALTPRFTPRLAMTPRLTPRRATTPTTLARRTPPPRMTPASRNQFVQQKRAPFLSLAHQQSLRIQQTVQLQMVQRNRVLTKIAAMKKQWAQRQLANRQRLASKTKSGAGAPPGNSPANRPNPKDMEITGNEFGFKAGWKNDKKACVIFHPAGKGVSVSGLWKGNQPDRSAGFMVADALRAKNMEKPSFLKVEKIMGKQRTTEELERGVTASDTLLGKTISNAAADLGGNVTGWSSGKDREGKPWVQAEISY